MIINETERAHIQEAVIQAFTQASILQSSYLPSPLRLSFDKQTLIHNWMQQWKPRRQSSDTAQLTKTRDWSALVEKEKSTAFNAGWYQHQELLALCSMRLGTPRDDSRFKRPSVAITLFERSPTDNWFKGLTRPFYYETIRQIALIKAIPDIHVLGSYLAPDQDDFDLFFGMRSDLPDTLRLKDCQYRTKKSDECFDWASLPVYLEMQREKKNERLLSPTPAV